MAQIFVSFFFYKFSRFHLNTFFLWDFPIDHKNLLVSLILFITCVSHQNSTLVTFFRKSFDSFGSFPFFSFEYIKIQIKRWTLNMQVHMDLGSDAIVIAQYKQQSKPSFLFINPDLAFMTLYV